MPQSVINPFMTAPIVQTAQFVTLLGAATARLSDLRAALRLAPILVAADGGAALALRAGLVPEAVIGDMDSLPPALREGLPPARVWPVAEQDSTDFEKSLDRIAAPLVLALGMTGGRLDHTLAAFAALAARPTRRVMLMGRHDAAFLCPPRLALTLPPGARFSLFPLAPTRARSRGLHWPLDGLDFAPEGRIATSNRATGGALDLEIEQGSAIVLLERRHLARAVRALGTA